MATRSGPIKREAARRDCGFTLLEVLVALGVVSIAALIAVSFYLTSVSYADTSRHYKVAAGIAEEQLNRLIRTPQTFVWPKSGDLTAGKVAKLAERDAKEDAPYSVEAPDARPLGDRRAAMRETNFYSGFTWAPYATLPKGDSPSYLEVSVVVRWAESGSNRSLTLTSAVPRAKVEGLS